jgi:glycine/D-amino acid oxidase-like deaminating enzyme
MPGLVVIGGGIVGAATAFFAGRRGFDCTVLEARREPASLTTAVAAGGYRLQLEHADELGLVRRSVHLFERFAETTGQRDHSCRFDPRGYLWLTTDEAVAERQHALVERQRSWGVDGVELWSGDAVRARFPWVSSSVIQARFRARDGFIDPVGLTRGLLAGSGADVLTNCRVTGFSVVDDRLQGVETSRGPIGCDAAVIACGPLSGTVAVLAGVVLPLTAVRRHRVSLRDVPDVPRDAPMTIDEDTAAHWRPTAGGAIALLPESDEPAGAAVERVSIDAAFADRLLDPASPTALARVAPFWRDVWRGGRARWTVEAGQYTMTPDQRPLIGESSVVGLWVNTGYSGHGVMAGPGGSELLADLLAGASSAEHAPFSLDRAFGSTSQRW